MQNLSGSQTVSQGALDREGLGRSGSKEGPMRGGCGRNTAWVPGRRGDHALARGCQHQARPHLAPQMCPGMGGGFHDGAC